MHQTATALREPSANTSFLDLRVAAADRELRAELATDDYNCREFSQLAHRLLGDITFSVQYVYDPNSHTGVSLRVTFLPKHQLEPLDIAVHAAWVAWQLQPQ